MLSSCFLVHFLSLVFLLYIFLHSSICLSPVSPRYLQYIRHNGGVYMYLIDRDNSIFSAPALCFHSHMKPGEHITETLADSVSNVKLCGGMGQVLSVKYMYSTCVTVCLHYSTYSIISSGLLQIHDKSVDISFNYVGECL